MAANYSYHDECLNAMDLVKAGVINLPTGSGKSRIEFRHASKVSNNKDKHTIVIFVAPRIILCQQLIKEFAKLSAKSGGLDSNGYFDQLLTFVSSGAVPKVKFQGKKDILKGSQNTTDKKKIGKEIKLAEEQKVDNYIFSTYASFWSCLEGVFGYIGDRKDEFSIHLIADEAHYFPRGNELKDGSERAFDALLKCYKQFDTRFFFTATPKIKEDVVWGDSPRSSGLNNSLVYGEVIFQRKPAVLIPLNVICEPLLHKISLPKIVTTENFDEYAGDFILKAFFQHEEIVNSDCRDKSAGYIGAKLLVSVKGSEQLATIINSEFLEKAREHKINVAWTMSVDSVKTRVDGSDDIEETQISTVVDGVERRIDKFLQEIKEICQDEKEDLAGNEITVTKNQSRMIILHYDRLTEGIDIPSMTGILIMRGMTKDKMIQNIGRVMRTHPDDKSKDFADRLKNWIKPYARVIVPVIDGMDELISALTEHLRDEYGYNPNIEINSVNTAIGVDGKGKLVMKNKIKEIPGAKTINEDLLHDVETYDEWEKLVRQQIKGGEVIPSVY